MNDLMPEELLHELFEGKNLLLVLLHVNELVQVVLRGGRSNRRVGRGRFQPIAVALFHVATIRSESVSKIY